jgi:HAE1 family hydrophobic/amphiphilic exporter-1
MWVGLLRNNAGRVVEFAVQEQLERAHVLEAALRGAKVRFRPNEATHHV